MCAPSAEMPPRSHVIDAERRVPHVSTVENQFWLHPDGLKIDAPEPPAPIGGAVRHPADADGEQLRRPQHESIDEAGEQIARADVGRRFGPLQRAQSRIRGAAPA